jgi:hypothetical protein
MKPAAHVLGRSATYLIAAAFVASFALAGCTATQQARSAEPSGFLGDYSQLAPGTDDQALLVYVNPSVNWAGYHSILFDPVTIWYDQDLSNIDLDEAKVLADYLDASIRHELQSDYTFVNRPGAGVMRLRVALTEAQGAKKVLHTVSTVIPQLRLLSTVKRLATGTHAFVGRAGIEAEIEDSLTERRLAAAVDRRVGGKRLRGPYDTWGHVQTAFDYWAERLHARLTELRAAQR